MCLAGHSGPAPASPHAVEEASIPAIVGPVRTPRRASHVPRAQAWTVDSVRRPIAGSGTGPAEVDRHPPRLGAEYPGADARFAERNTRPALRRPEFRFGHGVGACRSLPWIPRVNAIDRGHAGGAHPRHHPGDGRPRCTEGVASGHRLDAGSFAPAPPRNDERRRADAEQRQRFGLG